MYKCMYANCEQTIGGINVISRPVVEFDMNLKITRSFFEIPSRNVVFADFNFYFMKVTHSLRESPVVLIVTRGVTIVLPNWLSSDLTFPNILRCDSKLKHCIDI